MIDIKDLFLNKMVEDIGYAYEHGVLIKTPKTYALPAKEINNTLNFNLPQSLTDLYSQTAKLEFIWEIVESETNTKQFKEDPFLTENYFNKGYDWGVVKDMLSGYINITNAEAIFDPEFCKQQAYYYRLDVTNGLGDKDSFFPFDIQRDVTACLKKEGNTIMDNVWLIHTDAEKKYDMKITIEEYLKLAYEAKGISHWQLVYFMKQKASAYDIMKRVLPKILPHIVLNLQAFGI